MHDLIKSSQSVPSSRQTVTKSKYQVKVVRYGKLEDTQSAVTRPIPGTVNTLIREHTKIGKYCMNNANDRFEAQHRWDWVPKALPLASESSARTLLTVLLLDATVAK